MVSGYTIAVVFAVLAFSEIVTNYDDKESILKTWIFSIFGIAGIFGELLK